MYTLRFLLIAAILLSTCLLFTPGCILSSVSQTSYAQSEEENLPPPPKVVSHRSLDQLLQTFVDDEGGVDYVSLKADSKLLTDYLDHIAIVKRSQLKTEDERLAFWINAYNACTLQGVLNHLPEDQETWKTFSVKDVKGFWKKDKYKVARGEYTLDTIEHGILRKDFEEPRVHFAIVCASGGCPALQNQAFFADTMEGQLQTATIQFVNDSNKVKIDVKNKKILVSKIFKWFEGDFLKKQESVQDFVKGYVTNQKKQLAMQFNKFDLGYLEYDWSLNIQD